MYFIIDNEWSILSSPQKKNLNKRVYIKFESYTSKVHMYGMTLVRISATWFVMPVKDAQSWFWNPLHQQNQKQGI